MAGKSVMIVRVPNYVADGTAEWLRDFIVASLPKGVIILPVDVTYEVVELPSPLGGIAVSGEAENAMPMDEADLPPTVKEKRLILERLVAYREAHGLGCLKNVAKKAGKGITDDFLRRLLMGSATASLAEWHRIGDALSKLEATAGE